MSDDDLFHTAETGQEMSVAERLAAEALIVDVDGFEGPLDLLLTLGRTQKVDLRKISILHLAQQYLAFVERAKALRLELAADYRVFIVSNTLAILLFMLVINRFMKKLKNIDKRPYQGIFKPLNPQKYKGNVNNIIYRSSWEKRFMIYCDKNRSVLEWGSEEIAISYRSVDNRPGRAGSSMCIASAPS